MHFSTFFMKHSKMHSQITSLSGLDLEHSKILIERLGKFHATLMKIGDTNPTIFEIFNRGLFYRTEEKNFMIQMFEASVKLLMEVVKEWTGYEKIVEKLGKLAESLEERIVECVEKKSDFPVLAHGDLWTNNVMYRYLSDSKTPNDIVFVSL